ncbi:putative mitochondrial large ribosomal subunit YmL35 [Xylona heveae TC161]|uniref:Large ribosomal subunit protein mL38 n=1 Tax=Xylona heveae (strain CBS 132557 / TC161) TaxID=1328760 RepID=A0A165JUQ2_XYLHT|nr:putative mitochondrial large ribosomal subunit YmL35 [Xylona heveae TC161]KZF26655.1 putative mitochondrial large ribosomal subunit YmL35 [Xylona heveae TC161]
MSGCKRASKPLASLWRQGAKGSCPNSTLGVSFRSFTAGPARFDEANVQSSKADNSAFPDPATAVTPSEEEKLIKAGILPVGSRRRRLALQTTANIPFEQLPYQCFQEARKVLQADREEKLKQIESERARIAKLQSQDPAVSGGEVEKARRLRSMQNYLEKLKILADINDPLIKKRFEDGQGDMNRPIYRYLADKKWREYQRPLIVQRITQMNVVPDILPHLDPVADVRLAFRRHNIQPGQFVDSRVSESPARLKVQVFDKGERFVTVAVVDPDVPNLEKDSFDYRCHFLAANIPISPTSTSIPLSRLSQDSTILPWLPPFAQKGSPYHRLSVFVLEQPNGQKIETAQKAVERDGFNLRSFADKNSLKPIGAHLFRTQWDEGTAAVMARAGLEGADIELRRKRVEPLPYKKKDGARYR